MYFLIGTFVFIKVQIFEMQNQVKWPINKNFVVFKTTWACFQICDELPSNVWKIGGAPLTPFDYKTCYNFIYITYIPYYIPYIVIVTKITTLKFLQPHLTTVLRIRHPHWNIILKVIQLWKKMPKMPNSQLQSVRL